MKQRVQKKSGAGFTLIELMIVIAIIGVLISVGLTTFRISQMRSRDSRRKNDLRQIASALEFYYNDYGTYPPSDASTYQIKGCGTDGATACVWGSPFQTVKADGVTLKTMYMPKLSGDPSSGRWYNYVRTGINPPSYKLYAPLEVSQDPEYRTDITAICGTSGTSSLKCTYGVASSNTTP